MSQILLQKPIVKIREIKVVLEQIRSGRPNEEDTDGRIVNLSIPGKDHKYPQEFCGLGIEHDNKE